MADLARFITTLPLSQLIRKISWLVPLLQTIHILTTGIVLASVIMIDLRIWGYSRSEPAIERTRRFLPWIWIALVLLTLTGIGLTLAAPRVLSDPAFQAKMLLMVLAIAATIAAAVRPRSGPGGDAAGTRQMTSLLATVALLLWVGVTFAGRGRWIANVLVR